MARPRHPNKHIEQAVAYAESLGWEFKQSHGHAWGRLTCPRQGRDGCMVFVHSTPRNPENHARHIQREVDLCPHGQADPPIDEQGDADGNDYNAQQHR